MKHIEVDEELYQFILSQTQVIGEDASSILRRLFKLGEIKNDEGNTAVTSDKPIEVKQDIQAEHRSVFNVINKEELAMQRGAVGRFLIILAALHRVHPESFSKVCDIRGRDRLYFAKSEEELKACGSSTKPRQIPDSEYWVITNSNTTRKKMMLTEVAKELNYSNEDIESIRDLL